MGHRGTSLIENNPFLAPYSRRMPRALWRTYGGGGLMSEVPLYWRVLGGLRKRGWLEDATGMIASVKRFELMCHAVGGVHIAMRGHLWI